MKNLEQATARVDKVANAEWARRYRPKPDTDGNVLPMPEKPKGLADFAINDDLEAMREQMLNDVYVLHRLAILGQFTVIYAEQGSGKTLLTLWLLREAIRTGRIDGSKVYYLNCDDSYGGLMDKAEFAKEAGFLMLSDGQKGFSADSLIQHLQQMADDGAAHGAVVVLDTLKKFVDLMDKSAQRVFNTEIRRFVQTGGTVIGLAHVNKHRDAKGKPVYSGTADAAQDADCIYVADAKRTGDRVLVTFESRKMRGDVDERAAYSFERLQGMAWPELIETVRREDKGKAQAMREQSETRQALVRDADLIRAVRQVLADGPMSRTDLVRAVQDATDEGRKNVRRVLRQYTGDEHAAGARWRVVHGDKNTQLFHALPDPADALANRVAS